MATLAAGITYEMKRKTIQGTLPGLTTLNIEALGMPNTSNDKFIFINDIRGSRQGGPTFKINHLFRSSASGSSTLATEEVGNIDTPISRVDFFSYSGTAELWRHLYPGDSLRLVVDTNSFSSSNNYNLIIWFTEVKFKGQFELL